VSHVACKALSAAIWLYLFFARCLEQVKTVKKEASESSLRRKTELLIDVLEDAVSKYGCPEDY
jgi:hypothetical protein